MATVLSALDNRDSHYNQILSLLEGDLQLGLQENDYYKKNIELNHALTVPNKSMEELDECILQTIISEGILVDL